MIKAHRFAHNKLKQSGFRICVMQKNENTQNKINEMRGKIYAYYVFIIKKWHKMLQLVQVKHKNVKTKKITVTISAKTCDLQQKSSR